MDVEGAKYALINPEIVRSSGEVIDWEGCLSIPGFVAEVHRHAKVTVKARDRHGKEFRVKGEDLFVLLTADHVFGEVALDGLLRMNRPSVLVDPEPERDIWEEGTRVRIAEGRALEFGKHLVESAIDCGASCCK